LFLPATFEASRPNLYFLCTEPDPRKGADALGTEVVLGKGHREVTPAMREWDQLGWFQMAMFAVVRATCCETAPPLERTPGAGACEFDGALMALGEAVTYGGEDDCSAAVDRYLAAIQCLVDAHYANAFGEKGAATPRQRRAFDAVSQRVRTVLGR
jgi:serine/threonine-protein kinase